MLISLGSRPAPRDLIGLLLDCHQRIRTFVRLAEDAGGGDDVPESERLDACSRVERYFQEALPLHVADEEESLLPRLRGRRDDLDRALDAMHAEHEEHQALTAALLAAARALRDHPSEAEARARLRSIASELSAAFERHLAVEEAVVFPAVRELLVAEVQAEIMAELRERRRPAG